jgi:hypothetical protein
MPAAATSGIPRRRPASVMSLFHHYMGLRPLTIAASARMREARWLANAGLVIMAAAFVWWFLFYAQWTGALRLLDLKVPCLVTTLGECSFFQSRLDAFRAAGPAYHPAALWIGVAAFVAGRASGMLLPAASATGAMSVRRSQNDGALRD